jgi:hypothetical protein
MDETTGSEQLNPKPTIWHTHRQELLEMSEQDRIVFLDEKANRLYNAITAMVAGDGKVSKTELDILLNPELHRQDEDYDRFTKESLPE